jgi:hypothetical protein
MFRKLRAIEIAEGALLADVALVLHLLWLYLPIAGQFFALLVFIIFAILVLRRGLYVGIMGLGVALLTLIIVTGFHGVFMLVIEGTGGLFLGITMRWRWRHIPLVIAGTTCGTFFLVGATLLLFVATGQSLDTLVTFLHHSYEQLMNFSGMLMGRVGLGVWWKQNVSPFIGALADIGFRFWPLAYFAAQWLILFPFVGIIYAYANATVRLFGYQVRPFPGGWLGKQFHHFKRRVLRWQVHRLRSRRVKVRKQAIEQAREQVREHEYSTVD